MALALAFLSLRRLLASSSSWRQASYSDRALSGSAGLLRFCTLSLCCCRSARRAFQSRKAWKLGAGSAGPGSAPGASAAAAASSVPVAAALQACCWLLLVL